jgi:hypothetical protein
VGNTIDFFAHVTGQLTSATGSFKVTPTTPGGAFSETGNVAGKAPAQANSYAVQLNVPVFNATQCQIATVPANCYGWEQFFYSSSNCGTPCFDGVEIEYWLIGYNNPKLPISTAPGPNYNPPCPPALPTADGTGNCYLNPVVTPVNPVLPVTDLNNMTLTGSAAAGGDQATLTDGTQAWTNSATAGDLLGLATNGNWNGTEFNVFGDEDFDEALFSGVQSIQVTTVLHNGTTTAPSCSNTFTGTNGTNQLFWATGETNNLFLAAPPTLGTQPSPTMAFNETAAAPAVPASCADAAGVGDTHLDTFNNMLYDFQAQGDYELVSPGAPLPPPPSITASSVTATPAAPAVATAASFTVEERQVSGAPSWPNAAVNQAVAAHVGTSDVAVCTSPTRLEIDGSTLNLADGTQQILPGGASVTLNGNVYLIRDGTGNSVQATVQSGNIPHVDVSVGLGQWPEPVQGLLANAGNSDNAIQSSLGTLFTAPFAFNDIYGPYGNSWLVPANQDLLSACDGEAGGVVNSNPTQPFYASDLPSQVFTAARGVCVAAGVQTAALLNACIVDVAVLGDQGANVYRTLPAPGVGGTIGTDDADLALTNMPADQTVNATSPNGAAVAYTPPTVVDEDSSLPTATCSPASGTTFAIGVTTVTCTVSAAGDLNSPWSQTFTVNVLGTAAQLANLKLSVSGVGPGTSLADKVTQAQAYLAANDTAHACAVLGAFIMEVKVQTGITISKAVAPSLIASATRIRAVLGC